MTTPEHTPAQTQSDIPLDGARSRRSWAAGLISLSRTIVVVVATALVIGSASTALAAGGASHTRTAITKVGVELVTAGGAPRYVTTSQTSAAWRFRPGVDGLAELRWGQGGRPVLAPLGTSR